MIFYIFLIRAEIFYTAEKNNMEKVRAFLKKHKLRAEIFMMVHDSIVAIVHPDDVEKYCELLAMCTQKDRGFSIPGCPIGIDQEVGDDYSFEGWGDEWRECYDDFIQSSMASLPTE